MLTFSLFLHSLFAVGAFLTGRTVRDALFLANMVVGLVGARVATTFGTSALLLMCVVLLLGTAIASFGAGHAGRQRLFAKAATGKPTAKRTGGAARVMQSSHLRAVAALSAV